MRVTGLSLLAVLLVACAPRFTLISPRPVTQTSYVIDSPDSAGIGDPIFDVQAAVAVPAFRVTRSFEPADDDLREMVPGMRFLATHTDPDTGELLLTSPDYSERYALIAGPDGSLRPGVYSLRGQGRAQVKEDIEWPAGLLERDEMVADQEGGFRAQMLYSGMDGTVIRTAYREFSGNLIRAAFSQDLQYDLAQDSVIAYRSIRIRVTSATNEHIEYMVVEDGGLPWLPVGGG